MMHNLHDTLYENSNQSVQISQKEALKGETFNLKIRASMMHALIEHIKQHALTQKEAAKQFGVSQPRISSLHRGKIHLFTIDALINMLFHAKIPVSFSIRS